MGVYNISIKKEKLRFSRPIIFTSRCHAYCGVRIFELNDSISGKIEIEGVQMGLNHEKNKGRKARITLPLKRQSNNIFDLQFIHNSNLPVQLTNGL